MRSLATPYFDHRTTLVIKGIALILMFIHHFYTFPDWWIEGIDYPNIQKMSTYLCWPLKICVPIFCFITGYVYVFNKRKNFKYSSNKIAQILIRYWFVFFVLAAVAYFRLDYKYSTIGFIKECFALYCPTMIFCWYVRFYIVSMIFLPILSSIMCRNIYLDVFVTLFAIPLSLQLLSTIIINGLVSRILLELSIWFPVVLSGMIVSNYNIFHKLQEINNCVKSKWINVCVWMILIVAIFIGRYYTQGWIFINNGSLYFDYCIDFVTIPVFIYSLVNLIKEINWDYVNVILSKIGKQSLLMWFLSCAFFGNCKMIFQPILYAPKNPILVLIWGLLICYLFACIFSFVVDKILYVINQMKVAIRLRINKLQ